MVNTRRLYKLESILYKDKNFRDITKQESEIVLRTFAKRIWATQKCKNKFPEIRFGKGIAHGTDKYSWCDGSTIELAPRQRDKLTLIHELVHAMGYDYHNEPFVTKQLLLLIRYTPINKDLLTNTFEPVINLCY